MSHGRIVTRVMDQVPRMLTRRAAAMTALGSPLLAIGAAAVSTQVDLFRQGDEGVHTYRIPALIETPKGTLVAVADARHDSARDLPARISLVMRTSRDRGHTWSRVVTIRQAPEGGVGDASLLADRRSGRIWCFHSYGPPGIGFGTAKPGARTGPSTFNSTRCLATTRVQAGRSRATLLRR